MRACVAKHHNYLRKSGSVGNWNCDLLCDDWDVNGVRYGEELTWNEVKEPSGVSFPLISVVGKAFTLVEPTGKSHIYLVEYTNGVLIQQGVEPIFPWVLIFIFWECGKWECMV